MKSLHRIISAAAVLLIASLNAFSQTPGNDKVHVRTYIESFNYETMTGTVAIESFVENDIKDPSASVTPLDIVLVIDASNSMDTKEYSHVPQPPYTYTAMSSTSYTYNSIKDKYYYYKYNDEYCLIHQYHGSSYCLRFQDSNGSYHFLNGTSVSDTEAGKSGKTTNIWTGVLYTQSGPTTKTRLELVKEAAENFVDVVFENSSDETDNKIALVKFTATATGINGFLSVKDYKSTLLNNIENITSASGTGTDLGVKLAKDYIDNLSASDRSGRNQVVVIFSDGEPSVNDDDPEAHKKPAINYCKAMKDDGVTIYSVGLLNGQYSTQEFMDYMSSHYPNASYGSSVSPGSPAASNDYFFNDPTGNRLDEIFKKIAESIVPPKLLFGTDTEVQCEISSTLTLDLPSGGTSDIKAYTANCTGVSGGVFSFDTQIPLSGLTVTVNSNGITTNGFDYSENWCGEKNSSAHGKELILKIPFKFTPTALTDKLENIYASGKTPAIYKDADLYALATAPAAPEFVELIINKSGLLTGESAIFEIDRAPLGTETANVHVNRIVLTGTADDGTTVSHKVYFLNPAATYSVTEHTDWSWTYKPTGTPQSNGFIKLSKDMTTVPAGSTATLDFVNTKYDSSKLPSNAEAIKK